MHVPKEILNYVTDKKEFTEALESALFDFYTETEGRISEIYDEAQELVESESEAGYPYPVEDKAALMIEDEFYTDFEEILRDVLWEHLDKDAALDLITEIHPSSFESDFSQFIVEVREEEGGEE